MVTQDTMVDLTSLYSGRSIVKKRFLLQLTVVLAVVFALVMAAQADAWVPLP